jgi:hypothetical protein
MAQFSYVPQALVPTGRDPVNVNAPVQGGSHRRETRADTQFKYTSKTAWCKMKEKKESVLTPLQKAMLDEATDDQLRAIRASVSSRLRKTFGGGRPRKKTARKNSKEI